MCFMSKPPNILHMPLENRARVQRFLTLAEEMGAKVTSISGDSVADSVLSFAREHNITKIVAGKPLRPRWYEILRGSVIDQIIRDSGSIDVNVVSDISTTTPVTIGKIERTHLPLWRYVMGLVLVVVGYPVWIAWLTNTSIRPIW